MATTTCQRCSSTRLASIWSHAADRHVVNIGDKEHCDYMPTDLGIGGGDDCRFIYCLDCGQIQGKFPVPETKLERSESK
jgi:hypothetical protein